MTRYLHALNTPLTIAATRIVLAFVVAMGLAFVPAHPAAANPVPDVAQDSSEEGVREPIQMILCFQLFSFMGIQEWICVAAGDSDDVTPSAP